MDFLAQWITARTDDLVINLSTEMIGVLLSIPVSVIFANYLDRLGERRRAGVRIKRLHRILVDQFQFLTSGIFDDKWFDTQTLEPWQLRISFIKKSELFYDQSSKILDSIEVDYIDFLNKKQQAFLGTEIRHIVRNNSVCIGLRSGDMQEMVRNQAGHNAIVERHGHWIVNNLTTMRNYILELENQHKILKPAKLNSIDAEILRREYMRLFDHAIPKENISMHDFFAA